MQVNMSAIDIVISLIVGVIGSIVAPAFVKKVANLQRLLKNLLAKRSNSATAKRLLELRSDLSKINHMDKNLSFQLDEIERQKNFVSEYRFVAIFFIVFGVFIAAMAIMIMVGGLVRPEEKIGFTEIKLVSILFWFEIIIFAASMHSFWKSVSGDHRSFMYLVRSAYRKELESSIRDLESRLTAEK